MKQHLKKIIATSGLMAAMVLTNTGITAAQYMPDISVSDTVEPMREGKRHSERFEEKLTVLAVKAGIDPEAIVHTKRRTIKQLLREHGVSEKELQHLFGNHRSRNKH